MYGFFTEINKKAQKLVPNERVIASSGQIQSDGVGWMEKSDKEEQQEKLTCEQFIKENLPSMFSQSVF